MFLLMDVKGFLMKKEQKILSYLEIGKYNL